MYVTPTIYVKQATFIDLPDKDFFNESLRVARERFLDGLTDENNVNIDAIKKRTPVIYVSTLSKQTPDEKDMVPRKGVINGDRARRKFIMIDADFDPGEEDASESLRQRIKDVASAHNTPVLIYPTASFPEKPRFRAVMFTKRVMSADQYYQAMSWWLDELQHGALDETDLRMSANRNAPVFTNQDQIDGVYSTLDDEGLELLDSKLWRDYDKPPAREFISYESTMKSDSRVNDPTLGWEPVDAIRAARSMGMTGLGATRSSIWKFIESVACGVNEGIFDEDTAHKMMGALAERANDEFTQKAWAQGNIDMLNQSREELSSGRVELSSVRPLFMYSELSAVMTVMSGD